MENSNNPMLKIELRNIRAISKADIVVNGITVIAGENGSGKSTISKLSYNIIKTSIEFDPIIDEKLQEELRGIHRILDHLIRDLSYFLDADDYSKLRTNFRKISRNGMNLIHLEDEFGGLGIFIDYLMDIFEELQGKKNIASDKRIDRIKRILNMRYQDKALMDKDIPELLLDLKKSIRGARLNANSLKEKRPLSILKERINEVFLDIPLKESYNLFEFGVPIIDRELKKLLPIHSISQVAYIDTPMAIGVSTYEQEKSHWEDINKILNERDEVFRKRDNSISHIFRTEILDGDVSSVDEEFDKTFVYKRNDGKEFDLMECATGLKSFAILQILFKNGFLTNETLLIIDEPEVHLHPQWVVEYARLIVLLNKKIGVKFIIASHHPDMISAIKYISESENVSDSLNFYLTENIDGYNYTYKSLGTEIDDIFTSFNIALERIDLYGATE